MRNFAVCTLLSCWVMFIASGQTYDNPLAIGTYFMAFGLCMFFLSKVWVLARRGNKW